MYLASLSAESKHQTMTIEEGKIFVEPIKELETLILDDAVPKKIMKIRTKLFPPVRQALTQFLRSNNDVFS